MIKLKMDFDQKQTFKLVLVGDPMVGKTSLRRRYLGEGFSYNYLMTIGADFGIKRIGNTIFQIWDLAGQENFEVVREGYYNGANGALVVFDVTRPQTYENIPRWIDEVVKNVGKVIPFILVGNKVDLRKEGEKWCVPTDVAKNYAETLSDWSGYDVSYVETSALLGFNVEKVFEDLVEEISNSLLME